MADILARMPSIPVSRLPELLPWNWSADGNGRQMAALMGRPTHVYTIGYVAMLIGYNLELVQEVARKSDNIEYG